MKLLHMLKSILWHIANTSLITLTYMKTHIFTFITIFSSLYMSMKFQKTRKSIAFILFLLIPTALFATINLFKFALIPELNTIQCMILSILLPTFITFFSILRRIQKKTYYQPISQYVTKHKHKSQTPTMGGLYFLLYWAVAIIVLSRNHVFNSQFHYLILFITFTFGMLGLYDDIKKIYYKNNIGISAKNKFILQIMISLITLSLFNQANLSIIQKLWWALVITSTANAVNLTDGLDGLAASCSAVIICGLIIFNLYIVGLQANVLSLAIMLGCLLSFLQFNKNPAKIFMGDVGSMSLGAFIAINYLILNKEWTLVATGVVFVLETLSVIMQISSIKFLNRKIFLIAPIHHHFEHYMPEKSITKYASYITIAMHIVVMFFL